MSDGNEKTPRLRGLSESPLPESNRRHLPYHGRQDGFGTPENPDATGETDLADGGQNEGSFGPEVPLSFPDPKLVAIAQKLRQEHLGRHNVAGLPWEKLRETEQEQWIIKARDVAVAGTLLVDGNNNVPGCRCTPETDTPCWMRLGIWDTSGCGSAAASAYLADCYGEDDAA